MRPDDLRRLDAAFFTVNGVISVVFCAFVLLDVARLGRTARRPVGVATNGRGVGHRRRRASRSRRFEGAAGRPARIQSGFARPSFSVRPRRSVPVQTSLPPARRARTATQRVVGRGQEQRASRRGCRCRLRRCRRDRVRLGCGDRTAARSGAPSPSSCQAATRARRRARAPRRGRARLRGDAARTAARAAVRSAPPPRAAARGRRRGTAAGRARGRSAYVRRKPLAYASAGSSSQRSSSSASR